MQWQQVPNWASGLLVLLGCFFPSSASKRCFPKHHPIRCSTIESLFLLLTGSRLLSRRGRQWLPSSPAAGHGPAAPTRTRLRVHTPPAAVLLGSSTRWAGRPVHVTYPKKSLLTLLSQPEPHILSVIFLDFRYYYVLLKSSCFSPCAFVWSASRLDPHISSSSCLRPPTQSSIR